MDDILYIIIGVVWLAISIYQSQRKMKQKQQKAAQRNLENEAAVPVEEEQPKKRSFIDEILEELNSERSDSPPTPPPPPPARPRNEVNTSAGNISVENYRSARDMLESGSKLSKEYYNRNKKTGKYDNRLASQKVISDIIEIEEYDEEIEDFEFDFNLREAIIYSEIINRPYT